MSKATTSGMGKGGLLLRLILSILLVFSLLGTVGSAVGVSVLCGPSQLISQMHRHDAGQKVYDSLNTRFQNDYNTTAVPAEVYMDTISVDWLEQCMENKVTALYGKGSGDIDFRHWRAASQTTLKSTQRRTTAQRMIPTTKSSGRPSTTEKRSSPMPQTCCGQRPSRNRAICPSCISCGH